MRMKTGMRYVILNDDPPLCDAELSEASVGRTRVVEGLAEVVRAVLAAELSIEEEESELEAEEEVDRDVVMADVVLVRVGEAAGVVVEVVMRSSSFGSAVGATGAVVACHGV